MTPEYLRTVVEYHSDTGAFYWKRSAGRVKAGNPAGYKRPDGYIQIRIDKKNYLAHRLAWLYVHKEWPKEFIDHINGDPSNNALSNLREASNAENMQNIRTPHKRNACSVLGVCRNKKRWRSEIGLNGKTIHLGTYDTPELAHEAYVKAKRKIHLYGTL